MPKALDETWRLLDDFADAAQALAQLGSGEDIAQALCELTVKIVGGDSASITSVRSGRATTTAATSAIPEQADALQYATAEGPCLDAIRQQTTFRVDDLATDPRWPRFGRQAAADLGMRSMLAHFLPVDNEVVGAVNVYATRPDAFTRQHEALIGIVGVTAVHALSAARHQQKVADLERALRTNRHIGVALGILMATHRVTLDEAWQVFVKASQNKNIKVSELAENIISTGSMDHYW